jgi:hypothetical protein
VLHPKIGAHKKSLPFLDVQEMGGSSDLDALVFLLCRDGRLARQLEAISHRQSAGPS